MTRNDLGIRLTSCLEGMEKASAATGDKAFFEMASAIIGSRFKDYVGDGPEEEEVDFDEFLKTKADNEFVADTEEMLDAKPDYLETAPEDLEEVSFSEVPARSQEDQKQFIEDAFSGVKKHYTTYKNNLQDLSSLIDFFEGSNVLSTLMGEYEIAKRAEKFAEALANEIASVGVEETVPWGPKAVKTFLVSDGFRDKVYMPAKEVYKNLGGV